MEAVSKESKKGVRLIIAVSMAAVGFLFWLIYFKAPAEQTLAFVQHLPAVNATLNALCAVCLVCGYVFVRRKNYKVHQRFMVAALVFSALFLVSYLTYHNFQGDTPYTGMGTARIIYFFILITHIVLSIFSLPMALVTVFYASQERFAHHRKLARWTLPVWLYVSVTGVIVYLMLHVF